MRTSDLFLTTLAASVNLARAVDFPEAPSKIGQVSGNIDFAPGSAPTTENGLVIVSFTAPKMPAAAGTKFRADTGVKGYECSFSLSGTEEQTCKLAFNPGCTDCTIDPMGFPYNVYVNDKEYSVTYPQGSTEPVVEQNNVNGTLKRIKRDDAALVPVLYKILVEGKVPAAAPVTSGSTPITGASTPVTGASTKAAVETTGKAVSPTSAPGSGSGSGSVNVNIGDINVVVINCNNGICNNNQGNHDGDVCRCTENVCECQCKHQGNNGTICNSCAPTTRTITCPSSIYTQTQYAAPTGNGAQCSNGNCAESNGSNGSGSGSGSNGSGSNGSGANGSGSNGSGSNGSGSNGSGANNGGEAGSNGSGSNESGAKGTGAGSNGAGAGAGSNGSGSKPSQSAKAASADKTASPALEQGIASAMKLSGTAIGLVSLAWLLF